MIGSLSIRVGLYNTYYIFHSPFLLPNPQSQVVSFIQSLGIPLRAPFRSDAMMVIMAVKHIVSQPYPNVSLSSPYAKSPDVHYQNSPDT